MRGVLPGRRATRPGERRGRRSARRAGGLAFATLSASRGSIGMTRRGCITTGIDTTILRVGRFISKDPIGLAGGTNLHLFVPSPVQWVDPFGLTCHSTRRASLREIRRQLGIPISQQPVSQKMIPLTDSAGGWILGGDKKPIMTRELTYQVNGKNVVIQDHSAGHYYGEGGVGDQPSHHNVRPEENTRTGKVDGMSDHYYFNCRNKK